MSDLSIGDLFFIGFILCVIHGIMGVVGCLRRRKAKRDAASLSE